MRQLTDGDYAFVCAYPIVAASGNPGPKLQEGDLQVPEGRYRIRELNPNSRYHLSLWLDYPNAFDRAQADAEGRSQLGGEIMIHGGASSKGCLAVGDEGAEDLFVLAALCGLAQVAVMIAPRDFRLEPPEAFAPATPLWVDDLYRQLARELKSYPRCRCG